MPRDLFEDLPQNEEKRQPRDLLADLSSISKDSQNRTLDDRLDSFNSAVEAKTSAFIDKVNAFGGGLQKAAAGVPGLAIAAYNAINGTNVQNPFSPERRNPVAEQAMQENPWTAAAGEVVPALAVPGKAIGNALVGAVTTEGDLKDRAVGAVTSALGGEAVRRTMGALGRLADAGTVQGYIKNAYNKVNESLLGRDTREALTNVVGTMYNSAKQASDDLFASFTKSKVPVTGDNLFNKVEDIRKRFGSSLTKPQKDILDDLADKAAGVNSLEGLHAVRKAISDVTAGRKWSLESSTGDIKHAYSVLREFAENDLKNQASKAGVLDDYNKANDYFKNVVLKLRDIGGDDFGKAIEGSGMDAAKVLDDGLEKILKAGKPHEIRVLRDTLDESGQKILDANLINKFLDKTKNADGVYDLKKVHKELSDWEPTFGKVLGDDAKAAVAGIKKIVASARDSSLAKLGRFIPDPTQVAAFGGSATALGVPGGVTTTLTLGALSLLKELSKTTAGQKALGAISKMSHSDVLKEILSRVQAQGSAPAGVGVVNSITE